MEQWLNRIGLPACIGAVVWVFTNFATAADIERIEARQIRSEVREFCYKWATAPDEQKDFIGRFVMDAVDELCDVDPDHRWCGGDITEEEVCH